MHTHINLAEIFGTDPQAVCLNTVLKKLYDDLAPAPKAQPAEPMTQEEFIAKALPFEDEACCHDWKMRGEDGGLIFYRCDKCDDEEVLTYEQYDEIFKGRPKA